MKNISWHHQVCEGGPFLGALSHGVRASAGCGTPKRAQPAGAPGPRHPLPSHCPPGSRNQPGSRPERQPLTGKCEKVSGRRSAQAAPRPLARARRRGKPAVDVAVVKLFTEHPELRAAFTELKASCVAMDPSQIETAMRAYLGHVDRVVAALPLRIVHSDGDGEVGEDDRHDAWDLMHQLTPLGARLAKCTLAPGMQARATECLTVFSRVLVSDSPITHSCRWRDDQDEDGWVYEWAPGSPEASVRLCLAHWAITFPTDPPTSSGWCAVATTCRQWTAHCARCSAHSSWWRRTVASRQWTRGGTISWTSPLTATPNLAWMDSTACWSS